MVKRIFCVKKHLFLCGKIARKDTLYLTLIGGLTIVIILKLFCYLNCKKKYRSQIIENIFVPPKTCFRPNILPLKNFHSSPRKLTRKLISAHETFLAPSYLFSAPKNQVSGPVWFSFKLRLLTILTRLFSFLPRKVSIFPQNSEISALRWEWVRKE